MTAGRLRRILRHCDGDFAVTYHVLYGGYGEPKFPADHIDGARQHRQIFRRNRERRREIDDVPERPHPDAGRDEAALEVARDRQDTFKFHHPDRAHNAHIFDTRQVAARREAGCQALCDCRHMGEARLLLEQVKRRIGGGARERVGHEGRPVHERVRGSSPRKASNTLPLATVAASGMVPPVSAFDSRMMSGAISPHGEHRAGATEAGEDFVEDQHQAIAVGRRAQAAQHIGIVEQHAAGALHQRLDNDARDLTGVAFQQLLRRPRCFLHRAADRRYDAAGSKPGEQALCMPSTGSLTAMVPMVSP